MNGLFLGRNLFLNHSTSAHLASVTVNNRLFHVQLTMLKLVEMRMSLHYGFEGRGAPGSLKLSVWLFYLYRVGAYLCLVPGHIGGSCVHSTSGSAAWIVLGGEKDVVGCLYPGETLRACWLLGSSLLTCNTSPKYSFFFSPIKTLMC